MRQPSGKPMQTWPVRSTDKPRVGKRSDNFIPPMLASPMKEDVELVPFEWSVEEKFDGHRMCISVAATGKDLFGGSAITAWSRYGKERVLPRHIIEALQVLPSGIYDGELLVPGKRSYGTAELVNAPNLVLMVFDVTELLGRDTTAEAYDRRRAYLEEIFKQRVVPIAVRLAESLPVKDFNEIAQYAKDVWRRDGEGAIVKRRASAYRVGKRDKSWMKIKTLRSAVLTLVGFAPGKMGPHATQVLRDDEGYETTVKWKDLATLAYFDQHEDGECRHEKTCVGRKVRIEYQERTPDGSYRHPRWDRWEDE